MTEINVAVDDIQYGDLRRIEKQNPFQIGQILRCQLYLKTFNDFSEDIILKSIFPNDIHFKLNVKEVLSQPIEKSAITHAIGRVKSTEMAHWKKTSEYPKGSTHVDILIESSGYLFTIPILWNKHVNISVPEQNQMAYASGVLMCETSFSSSMIFNPTVAEIKEIWLDQESINKNFAPWCILRLKQTRKSLEPDISVFNYEGEKNKKIIRN